MECGRSPLASIARVSVGRGATDRNGDRYEEAGTVLLKQATGKTLIAYLSEKIWKPYGMEQNAYWDLTPSGVERSGGGLSVTVARLRPV